MVDKPAREGDVSGFSTPPEEPPAARDGSVPLPEEPSSARGGLVPEGKTPTLPDLNNFLPSGGAPLEPSFGDAGAIVDMAGEVTEIVLDPVAPYIDFFDASNLSENGWERELAAAPAEPPAEDTVNSQKPTVKSRKNASNVFMHKLSAGSKTVRNAFLSLKSRQAETPAANATPSSLSPVALDISPATCPAAPPETPSLSSGYRSLGSTKTKDVGGGRDTTSLLSTVWRFGRSPGKLVPKGTTQTRDKYSESASSLQSEMRPLPSEVKRSDTSKKSPASPAGSSKDQPVKKKSTLGGAWKGFMKSTGLDTLLSTKKTKQVQPVVEMPFEPTLLPLRMVPSEDLCSIKPSVDPLQLEPRLYSLAPVGGGFRRFVTSDMVSTADQLTASGHDPRVVSADGGFFADG